MQSEPEDREQDWRAALSDDPRRARERDLRRYGPRRGPSTWIYWTIAVVGLLVFAVLMRAVMEKTRWTAAPPDAERRDVPTLPATRRADGLVRVGCFELVDAYSRTWVDRCGGPPKVLTPAQRGELARAAEAAR